MSKSIKVLLIAVMLFAIASFALDNEKKRERFVFHTFSLALPLDWSGTWEQYNNFKYENRFTRGRDVEWDMTMGLQLRWTRDLVFQSGLSFEVGAGIGFIDFPVNDSKIDSRFDLNAKVGLGFAPFVNDFILAVHAILGGDMKYLGESYHLFDEFTEEYSTLLFNFVGGCDIVLVYQITERLGINAGVDVTVNLLGFGSGEERFGEPGDFETTDYKLDHAFSGFQVVPHVGVSLRF